MKTKRITIEGVTLIVPESYHAPYTSLNAFPNCCGAGDGFGEMMIPETMYGLRISAGCHIHDESWRLAEATWADFHQTNSMFLHNNLAIIRIKSRNSFIRRLRNHRAVTYYDFVDITGAKVFKGLKGEVV